MALCTLAAALAVSSYVNTLHNPFVYDDYATVVENTSIRDLRQLEPIVRYSPFRPLLNLSYAVDHSLWGLNPFGYHLTNIVLHAANVIMFFWLASVCLTDVGSTGRLAVNGSSHVSTVAFSVAALFAVHPLLTEAVGYASGRSEVLCTTFVLATVLALRRAYESSRASWYVLAALVGLAALATKEVALVAPLMLLSYDWLIRSHRSGQRWQPSWLLLASFAVVAALAVTRLVSLRASETQSLWTSLAVPLSPVQAVLTEVGVVERYLRLLLVPVNQSLVHSVTPAAGLFDPQAIAAAFVLLLFGGLVVTLRHQQPLLAFGSAWFVLFLIPSSSLLVLSGSGEAMAEHRVYLASCGFFLGAGALYAAVLERYTDRTLTVRWALKGALAIIIGVLCMLTIARNRVWADPVTLWRDAAAKAPHTWAPHFFLGNALRAEERYAEAIEAYQTAIRLLPLEQSAYVNLDVSLRAAGRLEEANRVSSIARRLDLYPATFDESSQAMRACREILQIAPQPLEDCMRRLRSPAVR